MANHKIRGRELTKMGYHDHSCKSIAMKIMAKHFKHTKKEEKINLLRNIMENPEAFLEDDILSQIAAFFIEEKAAEVVQEFALKPAGNPYKIFGKKGIAINAIQQMDLAMRLPVAEKGALMPDAHHGYGLPIGGVLATKNAIIPYAIGLDIACRMSLSIFDAKADFLKKYHYQLKQALLKKCFFGATKQRDKLIEHEVLDDPIFNDNRLLEKLHGKACRQLGTSGSGNHFVDFGIVELPEGNAMNVPAGDYIGLLTHSGSRGLGASIATHYTQVARKNCNLPNSVQQLAWLDLDSQAGQEYWIAMQLAGKYAKACHDVIHRQIEKFTGFKTICNIENHHNFAWKEKLEDGEEYIVHRKGATPAENGVLGIIPGSMVAPAYIVSGKGNAAALSSAAHGAGRKMSRKKAKSTFTGSEMRKLLRQQGTTLIGGGVDEAPGAYKDISTVMDQQTTLVNIEGKFTPKLVRMDKN